MDGIQTQSRSTHRTEVVHKAQNNNANTTNNLQYSGASYSSSPKLIHKTQSTAKALAMHKLGNMPPANNNPIHSVPHTTTSNANGLETDAHGNTNITIRISDSSIGLRSKANNFSDIDKHDSDLSGIDDVTAPFKSDSNDNNLKETNRRKKGIFQSLFCCFGSSKSQPSSRNHSKPSNTTITQKQSSSIKRKTGTGAYINSNQFNNLSTSNSSTNIQANSSTVQRIPINTTNNDSHSNNNKNLKPSNNKFQNENGQLDNHSTGKNSYNNKADYNNNSVSHNSNQGDSQIQYNSNSYGNDANNNNLYSTPHYFSNNANDNINLHHIERPLLGPSMSGDNGKKCLIIDLDETLVHSSFKQVSNADFIVPVEIDGTVHQVYVLKRPHVDEFLKQMGKLFECVLFTASLAKYADPVADLLDKHRVFRGRLFREACVYYRGNYVKDLSRLGRDLNKVIIIDNSPASYIFHPDNAVGCTSWFDDPHDTELLDLIPHFEQLAACDSVYSVLRSHSSTNSMSNSLTNQLGNSYQSQSLIYSQTQQNYDENQQVPSPQMQSIIYQQQQQTQPSSNETNYPLNENKILLSIDLMMAKKQQQLQ